MRIEFVVPYPVNRSAYCRRFGLNAYWSGKHWTQRKDDAEDMHWTVRAAMSAAKIPHKLMDKPVRITFSHNTRMDIDNHAAIEKLIVDSLKGWVLYDDAKKYYLERVSRFWSGDGVKVEVEEIEDRTR